MNIRFVYGIFPAFIEERKSKWKSGRAATAKGPFVKILSEYLGEHLEGRAILEHELVHVRQFYRTFGMHNIIKKFSKTYKSNVEIEAYRTQIGIIGIDHIECCYIPAIIRENKKLSKEEARKALLK